MHRLISHLRKPPSEYHPRLFTKSDAEYVARDYNDYLEAGKMGSLMVFDQDSSGLNGSGGDSMEANVAGVPWKYGDRFMYHKLVGGSYQKASEEHLQTSEA